MKTAESNVDFASIGGIDPRAFPLTALEKAQNVCGGYVKNLSVFTSKRVLRLREMFNDLLRRLPEGIDINGVNMRHTDAQYWVLSPEL